MENNSLTLEERVIVLEELLKASIWGPFLEDEKHLKKIASLVYWSVDAAKRHNSYPESVQKELTEYADSLAEIDNIPDVLKPTIRPFISGSD